MKQRTRIQKLRTGWWLDASVLPPLVALPCCCCLTETPQHTHCVSRPGPFANHPQPASQSASQPVAVDMNGGVILRWSQSSLASSRSSAGWSSAGRQQPLLLLLLHRGTPRAAAPITPATALHYYTTTSSGSGSSSSSSSSSSASARPTPAAKKKASLRFPFGNRPPPVVAFPQTPRRTVPATIARPPYAATGVVRMMAPDENATPHLHSPESIERMRKAGRLARQALDVACQLVCEGITTDDIDAAVHSYLIEQGAYPSPLNYAGFPKSLCTSVNEVICHGIPDLRPLQFGDVLSIDVSCYVTTFNDNDSKDGSGRRTTPIGVHGDNCATVIVGDVQANNDIGTDWRGVPYRSTLDDPDQESQLHESRRLVATAHEALWAGIRMCRPGGCLSDIGAAIERVSDREGYSSVRKYRGHGIGTELHCPPFVRHYANGHQLELLPGMIFTLEPMITQGSGDCYEWDDDWTVSTVDGGLAAQFEHTVLITESGVEILTLLD